MHIVIIGNGIAGITTARYVRKLSDHRITVISSETDYFFSRTALMYIYMGHMSFEHTQPYEKGFWLKNRIDLLNKHVARLEPAKKSIHLDDGSQILYDKLVLATGSASNRFGWPGQYLGGVQGLYSYQDVQSLEQETPGLSRAVIVGGGLIGIELAEMLHSRHIPVTFLVREPSFWNMVMPPEESEMINREIIRHGIDLRLRTELKEILPDEHGHCRAVLTNEGEEIPCQFVGLTAGVHPRKELAEYTEIETNRGFLVDEYLQTSVEDIYAVGDCAELREPVAGRRSVEAVWYTGKHMGPVLARTLCEAPTVYQQKTWFNSAKFMDIEYQVYGTVGNAVNEGEQHLYWEHEDGRMSIRINYDEQTGQVKGFNLMGVRYRADICIGWIESGAPIESVLPNLALANFDPELYDTYEQHLLDQYLAQHPGSQLRLRKKRGLFSLRQS